MAGYPDQPGERVVDGVDEVQSHLEEFEHQLTCVLEAGRLP